MLNIVILTGRLGADPEVKETSQGGKFATLSLATNEKYKDKDGEYKEKTQWHKVIVWNPNLAESLGRYIKKGDVVNVTGQIEYRSYEADGVTKYITDIVVGRFTGNVRLIPMGKTNSSNAEGPVAKAINAEKAKVKAQSSETEDGPIPF
jgi:single-strand DNA-binding protein